MEWKKKSASVFSALAIAGAGMMAAAPPAAAAPGDCPAARLCIYDGTNFSGDRITSASTNACFTPWDTAAFGSIHSYVNNGPVTARVFDQVGTLVRTMPAGGFSSNIGTPVGGGSSDHVCLGNARP
ncbi:peptidase inhibitor family I36 protein [Streptomyces sp. NPDC057137]|uniref:peptidase inhibitor family I36 protein n=1 Tax=Streptomyces sp. NPDC057137 TaxID=3346030 RepID=UPI0036290E11